MTYRDHHLEQSYVMENILAPSGHVMPQPSGSMVGTQDDIVSYSHGSGTVWNIHMAGERGGKRGRAKERERRRKKGVRILAAYDYDITPFLSLGVSTLQASPLPSSSW